MRWRGACPSLQREAVGQICRGADGRGGRHPALMNEIGSLLHLDVPTVTGKTLRENIAGATVTNAK